MKLWGTPFLKNSSERLLLTVQVHKVDKNVSRHCNKYIKVISIEAILVTLCQPWKWFAWWKIFEKHHPEKTYQNFRNLQRKCLWRSFVITIGETFFLRFTVILIMILKLMILWNFIWKLLIQSPVKQLRWSLFVKNLLTCYSSKKVWGAFHHWRYIRRSWLTWYTKTTRWNLGLTPRPHSLSNFKDKNINNSLVSRYG